jgi:universal stress protein E
MGKLRSILVVTGRSEADAVLMVKAARLARALGMGLELFVCDAEQAYELKHAYDSRGFEEKVLQDCIKRAREYPLRHKELIGLGDVPFSVDASCESPLYESILRKVQRSDPALVIKAAGGGRSDHSAFDANDWQLMRTCPSTLALVRGRHWSKKMRIATAIDVSEEEETKGLADTILKVARDLARATDADLDVAYAERAAADEPVSRLRAEKLHGLTREAGIEPDHVHLLAGHPERELSGFAAARNYDVMVLGALTHRPSAVSLVGTLTSVLVEDLECDFVLVKPGSFSYGVRPQSALAAAPA